MPETITTDVAVIGGGPGGYVAAIKLGQLGKKVVCVEGDNLGGTCLNWGCIPSKVLLDDTHLIMEIKSAESRGISAQVSVDWAKVQARKADIVKKLTGGVKFLFDKNGVKWVRGYATFADAHTLDVKMTGGSPNVTVKADAFIIATGSYPVSVPGVEMDKDVVITSTEALSLPTIPATMLVVGGGAIGMEIGSVYNRLGTDVTVVEILDHILLDTDADVVAEATRAFKKQGFKFFLKTKVATCVVEKGKSARVVLEALDGGAKTEGDFEKILVSASRRPFTAGLGLDKIGVELTERGFVQVDGRLRTSVPHIYAVGDVVGGKLLAHKASHEGIAAAEIICGRDVEVRRHIPAAIFTVPEIATVGMTEAEAEAAGRSVKTGKFSFRANGKAMALAEAEGFAKVVGDADTDDLLGVHVIGPHASDLVAEATLALEFSASCEDFRSSVRIHPTLSEAVMEAALAVDKIAIHQAN